MPGDDDMLMPRATRWAALLLRRLFAVVALLAVALGATAPATAAEEFLRPEVAFPFEARLAADGRGIDVRYRIAEGYYMYRERFAIEAVGEGAGTVQLGDPVYPKGKIKFDETFGKDVETHRGEITLQVPVLAASGTFRLKVTSQGCADQGLCYPPMDNVARVTLAAYGAPADEIRTLGADEVAALDAAGAAAAPAQSTAPGAAAAPSVGAVAAALAGGGTPSGEAAPPAATPSPAPAAPAPATDAEDSRLAAALQGGSLGWALLAFFGAGLLLSFTPCVLPMVPILSSIIVGQENVTRSRGLVLAMSYALGMALVYTALGVAAGLAGEGLAAWLQKPWVLALFAAALVTLALSMFGFYELQLPARWRDGLQGSGGGSTGGRLAGVFAMGGVSALIVSPCVAAPLAGALLYISQSRDAVGGGAALFALAMGMSVPLLVVGASAGHLLPRSGAWMDHVKHAFGVLLIAVAIYMVQPVLPVSLAMAAWGALLLVVATYLRVFEPVHHGAHMGWQRFFRGLGVVSLVMGAIQLVGAASGGSDPLQPLKQFAQSPGSAYAAAAPGGLAAAGAAAGETHFVRVKDLADLEARVRGAGRPVMLDFYADWCVSCKEMERFTFTDPAVRAQLARAELLQADVTANSPADRELLKRFRLFGPPGIIFFDAEGRELEGVRVIGFQGAERFSQSLRAAGL
jgi:thiol:disulfide interchange protein DsbD